MNDNRQYLVVGIFVVVATTILISVLLWFSANSRKSYNVYQTVFNEPVDGITANSPIKYNGVEIGRVKSIQLDNDNPRNVIVILNIGSRVLINSETYAIIKPQGVTGMSFIDLRLPKSSISTKNLTPSTTPPYPKITSRPSLMFSLTEQAQSFTSNVQEISSDIKTILDDKNIQHFSNIMANLDKISTLVANKSKQMEQTSDLLLMILKNIKDSSAKLNETFVELNSLTKSLTHTSENTNNLILNIQNNSMQNINSVLLPNLNQAITHLDQSSYQLEQLLNLLNQNPSVLVRGKSPVLKGPGE